MEFYRLDRQAFSIQSFEEASKQRAYWLQKTPRERLAAAWYLICKAYKLEYNDKHPMDRTIFKVRQHSNG